MNLEQCESEHEQEGGHEKDMEIQLVEEKIPTSNVAFNDFQEVFDVVVYDDYEDDFIDQLVVGLSLQNDVFHKSIDNNQPTAHGHNIAREESGEFVEGNYLPL